MVERLTAPGFWVPGRRQAAVFVVLVFLGFVARGMGASPSGGAPPLAALFDGRSFVSFDGRPLTYAYPFYLGFNLYVLFALLAGFFFPRCFYPWGAALLLAYPFAEALHFVRLEAATEMNVVVPDGAFGWLSIVFGSVAFAVLYGTAATGLSTAGAGLRLAAGHLLAGRRSAGGRPASAGARLVRSEGGHPATDGSLVHLLLAVRPSVVDGRGFFRRSQAEAPRTNLIRRRSRHQLVLSDPAHAARHLAARLQDVDDGDHHRYRHVAPVGDHPRVVRQPARLPNLRNPAGPEVFYNRPDGEHGVRVEILDLAGLQHKPASALGRAPLVQAGGMKFACLLGGFGQFGVDDLGGDAKVGVAEKVAVHAFAYVKLHDLQLRDVPAPHLPPPCDS